jgi:transcriptional regulator with XRE-family HTH domain
MIGNYFSYILHLECIGGTRIRQRRLLLGITQETLAGGPGLSFQQIQKYEKANRVSALRLSGMGNVADRILLRWYGRR